MTLSRILLCTLVLSSLTLAPAAEFTRYDATARKLLARMTQDEKIGQMVQPDQEFIKSLDDIDKYHLGSVLSGGGSDPKSGNDLQSWTNLYNSIQQHALKSRLRIPLLYGIDTIHGNSNLLGAVIFPHHIGLGATRDAKLVEQIGRITAEETRATGINWGFGPCVTVPQDIRWGRSYEGFSDQPDIVKVLGAAETKGMQGVRLDDKLSILACAKHFAADGGTRFGTGIKDLMDHGDSQMDAATLKRIHLQGYITSIQAGVGSIMPSYNMWNGVRCSGSKELLTTILKGELGFDGFLISDYNAIDEIKAPSYKDQIEISTNAGMDMFMVPSKYAELYEDLKQLVAEGRVPQSRIDDAVIRILRVKIAMGMMDPKNSQLSDPALQKTFGSPEHRAVARQAVRESLVLMKNENHLLPLKKNAARIVVAGPSADNIGDQCGGWTIDWQGKTGNVTTGGTTVLQAIRNAVSKGTVVVTSKDGTDTQGATVGIVVLGERPYAEMNGDRKDLYLTPGESTAIANLKKAGILVVTVLFSGRPMFVEEEMAQSDAFIAAWLPGTEGAGVADVLFGDYKPTGKLSFTWPKATSTSLHLGNAGYQTLFKVGYGLSY